MSIETQADRAAARRAVRRLKRSTAAIIAQYIKDLTTPPGPGPLRPA